MENESFIEYQKRDSVLRDKSYAFALRIVKMVKTMSTDYKVASLFNQVLRSGTSIMANVSESEFAQSPQDFVSKLYIALKEANETATWLRLLKDSDCIKELHYNSIAADCQELIALLIASIKTSKRNQSQQTK